MPNNLAYEVANLSDEEFVEFFAWLRKYMLKNASSDYDDINLDTLSEKDIYNILLPIKLCGDTYKNLTDWLYTILREIICESDIDAGAWWKPEEEVDWNEQPNK